jgi:hypothetical protein
MASNGKKKTTMAKLNRETRLREKRQDKQARKDARRRAAALGPDPHGDAPSGDLPGELTARDAAGAALQTVAPGLGDT